jgi:hypothetical protein
MTWCGSFVTARSDVHSGCMAIVLVAQDHPTDCPERDKNGWTGDVHLACAAGSLNVGSAPLYGIWLVDVADSQ